MIGYIARKASARAPQVLVVGSAVEDICGDRGPMKRPGSVSELDGSNGYNSPAGLRPRRNCAAMRSRDRLNAHFKSSGIKSRAVRRS